jgi:hypothetical protein
MSEGAGTRSESYQEQEQVDPTFTVLGKVIQDEQEQARSTNKTRAVPRIGANRRSENSSGIRNRTKNKQELAKEWKQQQ